MVVRPPWRHIFYNFRSWAVVSLRNLAPLVQKTSEPVVLLHGSSLRAGGTLRDGNTEIMMSNATGLVTVSQDPDNMSCLLVTVITTRLGTLRWRHTACVGVVEALQKVLVPARGRQTVSIQNSMSGSLRGGMPVCRMTLGIVAKMEAGPTWAQGGSALHVGLDRFGKRLRRQNTVFDVFRHSKQKSGAFGA